MTWEMKKCKNMVEYTSHKFIFTGFYERWNDYMENRINYKIMNVLQLREANWPRTIPNISRCRHSVCVCLCVLNRGVFPFTHSYRSRIYLHGYWNWRSWRSWCCQWTVMPEGRRCRPPDHWADQTSCPDGPPEHVTLQGTERDKTRR